MASRYPSRTRDPEIEGELVQRLAKKYDVIPARVDPHAIVAPPGEVDPDDPTPASDALQWAGGE